MSCTRLNPNLNPNPKPNTNPKPNPNPESNPKPHQEAEKIAESDRQLRLMQRRLREEELKILRGQVLISHRMSRLAAAAAVVVVAHLMPHFMSRCQGIMKA